jgi:hypothetical protein
MPLQTSTFFLHGRILGQRTFDSPFPPRQLAYFCACCGEVWGRVAMSEPTNWQIEYVPCQRHQPTGVFDWHAIPGSFLSDRSLSLANLSCMSWARAIEHLPEEVLKREFEITTEWFDKLKGKQDEAE